MKLGRAMAADRERGARDLVARWRELLTGVTPVVVLGTLVCCALPIALVGLGAGSVVASLVSTAPWLAALSRYKAWVFLAAGLLLLANFWALYRSGRACQPGGVCHSSHPVGRWMRRVYWASVALYAVGAFTAYLYLPVLELLGS